jgi:predicted MPP superfamily phosphohydrolase
METQKPEPDLLTDTKEPVFPRRQLFSKLAACAALPIAGGAYSRYVEPFWPKYPEIPFKIAGLPKSFDGFRIAQITDMHAGRVPIDYLTRVVDEIRRLKPDAVLVTGDMIHHTPLWVDPIATLLATLPMPVFASFGNHEFGVDRREAIPNDPGLAEKMEAALTVRNIPVLRNKSVNIEHADGRLWFVGLDDLWFGHFDPPAAFAHVPRDEPVICLSHNPDTAPLLDQYAPKLILAGHTHGGQIRLPYYGAIRLNVVHVEYDLGMFQLPNTQLYVSSGVGYILKVRFNCRPEAPIFRLESV